MFGMRWDPWGPAEWSGNPLSLPRLLPKKGREERKARLETGENLSETIT